MPPPPPPLPMVPSPCPPPPTTRPPSPPSPTTQDLLSATSAAAVAQHQPGSSRSRSGWRRLKIRSAAWAQELVCGLLLLQPAAWAQDPVVLKIRRGRCGLKIRRGLKIRPVAWAQGPTGGGSSRYGWRTPSLGCGLLLHGEAANFPKASTRPGNPFPRCVAVRPRGRRGGRAAAVKERPGGLRRGRRAACGCSGGWQRRDFLYFFLFVGPAGQQHGAGGGPCVFFMKMYVPPSPSSAVCFFFAVHRNKRTANPLCHAPR
jgi:hypothetical protein